VLARHRWVALPVSSRSCEVFSVHISVCLLHQLLTSAVTRPLRGTCVAGPCWVRGRLQCGRSQLQNPTSRVLATGIADGSTCSPLHCTPHIPGRHFSFPSPLSSDLQSRAESDNKQSFLARLAVVYNPSTSPQHRRPSHHSAPTTPCGIVWPIVLLVKLGTSHLHSRPSCGVSISTVARLFPTQHALNTSQYTNSAHLRIQPLYSSDQDTDARACSSTRFHHASTRPHHHHPHPS
jgi:hypothetical protein